MARTDLECHRYATEEEARLGHSGVVEMQYTALAVRNRILHLPVPPMSPEVGMLDLSTGLLHRPGSVHLTTACEIPLETCTVGPLHFVAERAEKCCYRCFPGP